MISGDELNRYRQEATEFFKRAYILVTPKEAANLEIADFGLSQFKETGLGVLVYVNTERRWPRNW